MEYELIYDAANPAWENWSFIAFGLVFIVLGLAMVFSKTVSRLFSRGTNPTLYVLFSRFWLGFAVLWTTVAGAETWRQSYETASASRSNSCLSAEGQVQDFDPMPASGHKRESFTVSGVPFEYSDYSTTGGYNNTVAHGGAIVDGAYVRLCYIERRRTQSNIIVRVEILK